MRREPDRRSLEELSLSRAELKRRLTLALALRHPPSVTWADASPVSRKRKAPRPGGWATAHHLVEWAGVQPSSSVGSGAGGSSQREEPSGK